MELKGKVAVVTGGASGIGASAARALSLKGAEVVIADINKDGAKKVANELGALAITCDISKEDEINKLVRKCEQEIGPIEIFSVSYTHLTLPTKRIV